MINTWVKPPQGGFTLFAWRDRSRVRNHSERTEACVRCIKKLQTHCKLGVFLLFGKIFLLQQELEKSNIANAFFISIFCYIIPNNNNFPKTIVYLLKRSYLLLLLLFCI